MKAYPAYKNIGFDFLDSLPAHWNVTRLKYLSSVNFSNVDKHAFEGEIPVRLCNYVDVYKNDFIKPDMDFMKATATEVEIDKFTLQKGDVLITKDSESWDDIAVPAYVTESMDGVLCGYHLAQIRSTAIEGRFLFWVLCSSTLNDQYKVEAHGITRYGLGKDSIENSFIPIPAQSEQQAIADFLDRKTAQVDTLIAKKQRQIDLLQEQRAALINQAVTGRLDLSGFSNLSGLGRPMKPSGVEWLGEIPSHWEVSKIKNVCYVSDGNHGEEYPKAEDFTDEMNGVPFIRAGDILDFGITQKDLLYITKEKNDSMRKGNLHENDILIVNRGATIGKVALIGKELEGANLNSQIAYLRIQTPKVDHKYLLFFLSSSYFEGLISSLVHGGALPQLPLKRIIDIEILCPPKTEQEEIAKRLDSISIKVEKIARNISEQIKYLQEYRTALISEAVTGKMDVRETKT